MRGLRRIARLTPVERRTLWRTLLLLPRVELSLRLRGYERTRGRFGGDPPAPPPAQDVDALVAASAWAVGSTATRLPLIPAACLARSVTLWALLRRQGIDSEIVIAVRPGDGVPEAHAWVERGGVPLNESPAVVATYARLDRGNSA